MYALILAVFFASGFSALVYQVAWVTMLDKVFGITTFAASAVLGAYFGGLALGGYLGGELADRRGGLRTYGIIELTLGLVALMVPGLLEALTGLYRALYPFLEDRLSLLIPARFLLSFAVLVVPATLIGMALPVLVRALTSRYDEIGQKLPRLYGWNTLGSVLGALLTGYIFIGFLGIRWSLYLAVTINIVVGMIALWPWNRSPEDRSDADLSGSRTPLPADSLGPDGHGLVLAVTFCSGFAALGYEVAWFRVLGLLSDHRAHTFSAIVATVLLGIGAGSFAVVSVNRRFPEPKQALAGVLLGFGALGFLWLPLVTMLSSAIGALSTVFVPAPDKSGVPFAVSLAVTLLPCLMMGMSFPLAVQVYARRSGEVGRSVGRMYALNLMGATLGSVLTGFVLLPLFGAQRTLFLLSCVCFLAAGLLTFRRDSSRPLAATAGIATIAAGIAVFAPGDLFEALFTRVYPRARVLESYEDIEATVTLAEHDSRLVMYINGVHQADDSPAMIGVHRLIALVPSVLHGNVQDALVIGMGGGTTSGELARFTRNAITIVEISPGVIRAARAFGAHNRNIADSAKADTIVADGRNYLSLTDRAFDLIAADTIQPIHAHSSNLYSFDYYRLMASRLKQNGIALQWIDVSLREHEERILMRTFVKAFPHVAMWERGGIRFMLGSNEPLPLDPKTLAARLTPEALNNLAGESVADAEEFLALFTLVDDELRAAIGSGPIISDDHPFNEYFNLLRIGDLWKLLPEESALYRAKAATD